jgi:hypothetical protein
MSRFSEDSRRLGVDLLIAAGVNAVLFALSALVLWPMGKAGLAGRLAIGLCLFAIVVAVAVGVLALVEKLFRIESDPPSTAFVTLSLLFSGALQVGWSAYAALAARGFAPGASFGVVAAIYIVGFLSSFLAGTVVGAFFSGQLYKIVNAALAVAGYLIFAIWG